MGSFISVDGPNGAGKTTLIQATAAVLKAQGFSVHLTKEVTSTSLGQFIRESHREYRGMTLAFLLAADRENHLERDIKLALGNYDFVITDRYVGSSLVYQRLDGIDIDSLWKLNEGFLRPHLSLFITADSKIVDARLGERKILDRFEQLFSRQDEIRLFEEAMQFLQQKGFRVFQLMNDGISVEDAAVIVAQEILRAREKQ